MKEYNNRLKANKYCEYITGKELRKYVADKIYKYLGNNVTIFDGSCGSGQLEEYINMKYLIGVEIQKEASEIAKENFKNSKIYNTSFFLFNEDIKLDCVVMNPPFSIKFKDLTEEEKVSIQKEFEWKKSGNVDDIFCLKALKFSKRYGFFILFPGLTYRNAEKQFRKELTGKIVELNIIKNAFEDTTIDVVFLIVDLFKKNNEIQKEIYNCKNKNIVFQTISNSSSEEWQPPREPTITKIIDPIEEEIKARNQTIRILTNSLKLSKLFCEFDRTLPPFIEFLENLKNIIKSFEESLKEELKNE